MSDTGQDTIKVILLMTNKKSHTPIPLILASIENAYQADTRFRLVPKSMTLDDLERPLRTLF